MKHKTFFTIVIPTLNEEKYLPILLQDLSDQTNNDFEVIHIDGSSTDKTVLRAKEFKGKLDINTFTASKQNVSHQRNLGIEKAHGEWIIFMDADNRISSSFIDEIKIKLEETPSTDLFSTWVNIDNDKSIDKPIQRTINLGFELFKMIGKEWSFGALIGVRTKLAEKFKFDEEQKVAEDGIFIKSLIKSGYTFKIFKYPRYTYSLRRLEADGTLNYMRKSAKIALNYLQGKDFKDNDFGYKMEGGASYESKNYFSSYKLPEYIMKLPKKQLEIAKKLFDGIR